MASCSSIDTRSMFHCITYRLERGNSRQYGNISCSRQKARSRCRGITFYPSIPLMYSE